MSCASAEVEIVRRQAPLMLPSNTALMRAPRDMVSQNVDAVLVTEGEAEIVGIFTARDGVTRVLAKGRDPIRTTLADVMTDLPVIMTPDDAAIEAMRLVKRAQLSRPARRA